MVGVNDNEVGNNEKVNGGDNLLFIEDHDHNWDADKKQVYT